MKRVLWKIVAVLILIGVVLLAACAAPSPAPTQQSSSPPKSTAPSPSAAASTSARPTSAAPSKAAASPSFPSLSASSSAAQAAYEKALAGWDQVVAAAKKEGKVVLYTSPTETINISINEFQKANPDVKVELVGLRGSEIAPRLAVEVSSGKGLSDVAMAGPGAVTEMIPKGAYLQWFAPAGLKPGVNWIADPYGPQFAPKGDGVPVTWFVSTGVLINTEKVPPDKEPKTWMDLLDPFYQGKTTLQTFTSGGGANLFAFVVKPKLDVDAWVKGVNALKPVYSQAQEEQVRSVITGDAYAFWPVNTMAAATFLARRDLPLKYIAPTPAIIGTALVAYIPKTAPHPNAAKVLINWFLTEEAHLAQAKAGGSPGMIKGLSTPDPWLDVGSDIFKGTTIYWPSVDDVLNKTTAAGKEAGKLLGLE